MTSPSAYWGVSVIASCLMFLYGILRSDFSIILGQFISFYIYLWNLEAVGVWNRLGRVLQVILMLVPVAAVAALFRDAGSFIHNFFRNEEIPLWLVLFGSAGQILFTLRFVYQWAYSRNPHVSMLPRGFWIISLIGSAVIVAYGLFRKDPVLILGQSFGFVAYVRNLMIGFKKEAESE